MSAQFTGDSNELSRLEPEGLLGKLGDFSSVSRLEPARFVQYSRVMVCAGREAVKNRIQRQRLRAPVSQPALRFPIPPKAGHRPALRQSSSWERFGV